MKIPMYVNLVSEEAAVRRAAKIVYDQPLPIGGSPAVIARKLEMPGVKFGVLAVSAVRNTAKKFNK